jgi:glycosyltransferase involved in cell wall biosynthesis
MKIIAIITSYNEERYIRACLDHYLNHGISVYLLDNESTDCTVDIAKKYLNRNLIGIEIIPRKGMKQLRKMLMRKEELADELDADWLMHADIDEIRLPPSQQETLGEAFAKVDREGYNAINFMEYTFLPVQESPNHDHPGFQDTMYWYYPFAPRHPHRLNAWKKQARHWSGIKAFGRELIRNHRWRIPSVNLSASGGHLVSFPDMKPYPIDFKLKHYMVLSLDHAIRKYVKIVHDPKAAKAGMHGWRATATEHDFVLPSQAQMRLFTSDEELDPSNPLTHHLIVQQH